MRTEQDIDDTFREVEDLALSLIFGDGVTFGEELGLLWSKTVSIPRSSIYADLWRLTK